ncbi:hypothetical protein GCM10022381_08570 [Leifsonia kafniensis]|uniref:Uncharacterized protein n=1 Tax=Leifsonia kafniensis TaxID=475957 RepID=A0ABP7K6I3_9MICO
MWQRDDAPNQDAPPQDEARLAEFGPPVFGFVPQPRLRERGWSWFARDGVICEAQAHYWLADPSGDFAFRESPGGLLGTELRGYVFTDAIGSTGRPDEPVHAALVQHLDYVVGNHQKSRYQPGTPQWVDHGRSRRTAIETAPVEPATLTLLHVALPSVDPAEQNLAVAGVSVSTETFVAMAARIDDRIVTMVIHHADRDAIDIRLTRRV